MNLQKSLGSKIIFCEDYPKKIFIVISEKEKVDETKIQSLQEYFNKTIHIVNEEEEKGLLIGLLNKNREFLGLGIIQEIDYINRSLKVLTSHREEINVVQFSQIKIDQTGKELGITTLFSL
jgi:polynucleotide 5'-kinase involved in rRNA processing